MTPFLILVGLEQVPELKRKLDSQSRANTVKDEPVSTLNFVSQLPGILHPRIKGDCVSSVAGSAQHFSWEGPKAFPVLMLRSKKLKLIWTVLDKYDNNKCMSYSVLTLTLRVYPDKVISLVPKKASRKSSRGNSSDPSGGRKSILGNLIRLTARPPPAVTNVSMGKPFEVDMEQDLDGLGHESRSWQQLA